MKLANEHHFSVVPRGGGSGLSCGAVPVYGGLVLSTEKMNKILEINEDALYTVVEPGVRTSDLQAAVEAKGLFYAGDPCSGDSCFIGGNIATNAGGNRAVKYGTTRNQIYSIEVVMPTGEIVTLGARLHKQSTGYCLDQLIIGSEGTLGIITKATIKLLPKPQFRIDVLAIFKDVEHAIGLVNKIIKSGITPTCVEYIDNISVHTIEDYLGEKPQGDGHYMIIEVEGSSEDDLDEKAITLDEVCREQGAIDVLVADYNKIWRARKNFAEAIRSITLTVDKNDTVVPVDKEPELVNGIFSIAKEHGLIIRMAGHAGDGNFHVNILKNPDMSFEEWDAKIPGAQDELFDLIYKIGGRVSGEHGIGFKRKHLMKKFTDPDVLNIMVTIKKALDPNNVLNPGKIFDIPEK